MQNLGEFDAGVDRGHSCARCRRCQVILDENNCADPTDTNIFELCRLEEWVRGKGQASSQGGGDATDKIVFLVGSTPLTGLQILLVL